MREKANCRWHDASWDACSSPKRRRRDCTGPSFCGIWEAELPANPADCRELLRSLTSTLRAARHELTTYTGLWATDRAECATLAHWQLDATGVVAEIDVVLVKLGVKP
jgi:hypothetical protein